MKAQVKDRVLHIELPLEDNPMQSTTGKSLVIASTHGNKPIPMGDKVVYVGVNAFIKN